MEKEKNNKTLKKVMTIFLTVDIILTLIIAFANNAIGGDISFRNFVVDSVFYLMLILWGIAIALVVYNIKKNSNMKPVLRIIISLVIIIVYLGSFFFIHVVINFFRVGEYEVYDDGIVKVYYVGWFGGVRYEYKKIENTIFIRNLSEEEESDAKQKHGELQ